MRKIKYIYSDGKRFILRQNLNSENKTLDRRLIIPLDDMIRKFDSEKDRKQFLIE